MKARVHFTRQFATISPGKEAFRGGGTQQRAACPFKEIWRGSQPQMAKEISMRQSAISNAIMCQNLAKKLLTGMRISPAMNAGWLFTGQGTHFLEICN